MPTSGLDFSSLVFFGDSLTDNGNLFALTGGTEPPSPPYFQGRFSNGPTYAEIAPGLTGIAEVKNFAFGGAQAITVVGGPPIDLATQVDRYLGALAGNPPPDGTAAALYIGNNEILGNADAAALPDAADIVAAIEAQIVRLRAAGIDKVLLFTLPHLSATPFASALPTALVARANAAIDAVNGLLRDLGADAAIEIVDTSRFVDEISADAETFGFLAPLAVPIIDGFGQPTGITAVFSPENIAFFDGVHPTAAAHGVSAAFVAASLAADAVSFGADVGERVRGDDGRDVVFAGAGNDRVETKSGDDIVFAGLGGDRISTGHGDDLAAGGSGHDRVGTGSGNDIAAGNAGDDRIDAGSGDDLVILGRGNDVANAGSGNDLVIYSDDAGAADLDVVDGGSGRDTLRIEVSAAFAATAAFQADLDSFETGRSGRVRFASLDLSVQHIERIDVVVADVIVASVGDTTLAVSASLTAALASADLWGLL